MWDSEETQCARVWEQLRPHTLRGPCRNCEGMQAAKRPRPDMESK